MTPLSFFEEGRNCFALRAAEGGPIIDAEDYYLALASAIERAEQRVFLLGWQLDSRVRLRRREGDAPETFVELLDRVCRARPELHVYLLPWKHSAVYALEREMGQEAQFTGAGDGRVHYFADDSHPQFASHHQKLVVIDGYTAFLGGIDVCDDRWDDRAHAPRHVERVNVDGEPDGPYHDVQCVLRGEAARDLAELFVTRWQTATGETITFDVRRDDSPLPATLSFGHARVALARTFGANLDPLRPAVREVRALMLDAIARAEHTIYVETQYFTSRAILAAIARRMRERGSALDVVFILPRQPEGHLERLALARNQAHGLDALAAIARHSGARYGVYCTGVDAAQNCATYIHSKLMIVDDAFVTIGSANATNRSLGLDSELNAAWIAETPDLATTFRRFRLSLLTEHAGVRDPGRLEALAHAVELVTHLDGLTRDPELRLSPHRHEKDAGEASLIDTLVASLGDPSTSLEEDVFEEESPSRLKSLASRVVAALSV